MEEPEYEPSFEVTVNGITHLVIPGEGDFMIILDWVELTEIKHNVVDDVEVWEQIDGNLDNRYVQDLGEAIERHYM